MLVRTLIACAVTFGLFAEAISQSEDTHSGVILKIKEALAEEGFDPGEMDGRFTPETRAALRAFQSEHQLEATGDIDRPTCQRLEIGEDDCRRLLLDSSSPAASDPDTSLQQALEDRLKRHHLINLEQFQVEVDAGVLTLIYHGNDPTQLNRAVREVRSVPGVRKIVLRFAQ